MRNFIGALLLSILSSSCVVYGEHTTSDFAPIVEKPCLHKEENGMYLFTENEEINFAYEKIGIVEAAGGEFAKLDEVLDELKYLAWNNCANGIINIKRKSSIRETGTTFMDDEETYASKLLTGTAVRIVVDDEFINDQAGNQSSLDFVQNVEARKIQESKQTETEASAGVIALILSVIVAIMAI